MVTTVKADALSQGIDSQVWTATGLSAAPSLALALVVILFVRRHIMRPINLLASRSKQIAEGKTDLGLDFGTNDVIGQTAQALESMLRQLNNRMAFNQSLLDGICLPFVVIDCNNRITAVNPSTLTIIGRPGQPSDYHGLEVENFFGLDHHQDVEDQIAAIQAKSQSTAAATAEAAQAASQGDRLASQAGEVMQSLVTAVQQSAHEVGQTGSQSMHSRPMN